MATPFFLVKIYSIFKDLRHFFSIVFQGKLFSYEKLFGAKNKTKTDIDNERDGKDTSIARTTRLFYVACTRAQKSLAVIAYTSDKDAVKNTALTNGWFFDDEIIVV
jgi:DNA helicase-2/ATP-dependent DNA helicase PcrA